MNYVLMWAGDNILMKNGFARVRYAGTGFLLLHRTVIERLCEAHSELEYRHVHMIDKTAKKNRFALFDPIIDKDTGEYLSEDYAFCRRWTDLGGEIWIDTQSKLNHTGPITFHGDLASQFK